MSDVVIRAENLGKKYSIRHQRRERYTALRDVLTERTKALFRSRRNGEPDLTREDFWALRDVSFEVKRGEVLGIIGRNGAGKSTLLKILSRITEPTTGKVTIKGRVASLLEVGTGFHPELTGRENIFLNGAILGMSRAEIKANFDEIVAFAEVEKFLDTPVKRYSSGMYVRLAFAVAAHLEPEILIIDEVLAVGDAQFQKKCLGKMRDVALGGRTVLFVSHNLGVIRSLCPTACWLDRGQIQRQGSSMAIVDGYLQETFKETSHVVNVAGSRREGHLGSALRIESLTWRNGLPLAHDGAAGVEVRFKATSAIEQLSVGLGFATLDGTRLLTYETDLYGPRVNVSEGSSGTATLTIDHLPLAPGFYSVDVGARSGDMHALDYLSAASQVEVVPGGRTPANLIASGAGVRIPSQFIFSEC